MCVNVCVCVSLYQCVRDFARELHGINIFSLVSPLSSSPFPSVSVS